MVERTVSYVLTLCDSVLGPTAGKLRATLYAVGLEGEIEINPNPQPRTPHLGFITLVLISILRLWSCAVTRVYDEDLI